MIRKGQGEIWATVGDACRYLGTPRLTPSQGAGEPTESSLPSLPLLIPAILPLPLGTPVSTSVCFLTAPPPPSFPFPSASLYTPFPSFPPHRFSCRAPNTRRSEPPMGPVIFST